LRSYHHHVPAWKVGSLLFLGLALLLAVVSGDSLLVLAVGSAVAGIALLTMRRRDLYAERPAAIPQVQRAEPPVRVAAPHPRTTSHRMAVRRPRPVLQVGRRNVAAGPGARSAAAHMSVADAPGHM
jgi:hypothetical protein